jgi:eukaryotic-like serine/threonine-protein kinase
MTAGETATCPRCRARVDARLRVCPRCLLEGELSPALLGGSLELIEEIGRGGMGTVWKARHLRLGRIVAVKFLSEALAAQAEFAQRFEREAQALARLNHPRIVAVHDSGRDDGRPYIVMEYVDGGPLSDRLPLPAERVREIGLDVLEALAYAHEQGVVHRDIKPQNVLVERSGRAKVTDFGIARLLGQPSGSTVTTVGRVIGTPAYMAPEALDGAAPDARMDIYSAGVLLHEALTGERPAGRPVTLPGGLGRVIARAVAADPGARYASASEMRADLVGADVGSAALLASDGALAPDEVHWLRAVALVQALATAAALWAFVSSVTPRVMAPGDVQPLVMLGADRLPDGRLVSHARFETWPILAALAAIVVALVAQGLLRRHWRQAGLDRPRPEGRVAESTLVLACGAIAVGLYAVRRLVAPPGSFWTSYVPIAGGLLELGTLFIAWMTVLQAWRVARPLHREPRLWLGIALALVPPIVDLLRYLREWKP